MHRMGKFFSTHKTLFLEIGFLVIFSVTVSYANPPTSPYTAGATLNPQCAPGAANCTVQVSPWTMNGTNTYYNGGNVGIGTSNPTSLLTISGAGTTMTVGGNANFLNSVSVAGTLERAATIASWPNPGIGIFGNGTGTITDSMTAANTTLPNANVGFFAIDTLAAANPGVTYTNASSLYIAGAPVAGTNVSIGNPLALDVAQGNSVFGGNVGIGTTTPQAALDIEGDGTLLAQGTEGSGATVPNLGASTRLEWIPSVAAFRAGTVTGTDWDSSNVGQYSFATGENTIASGNYSNAFGDTTTASGPYSTAFGYFNNASGYVSTTFGQNSTASGSNSVAFGDNTTASGQYSVAFGYNTQAENSGAVAFGNGTSSGYYGTAFGQNSAASGSFSTAFGQNTIASGNYSNAFGDNTTASGAYSSTFGYYTTASGYVTTAFGENTVASGTASDAFGSATTAASIDSSSFGTYNIGGGTANSWIGTDPLFEVGNGISGTPSDALFMLKNGDTGIDMSANTPSYALDVGSAAVTGIDARFTNSTGYCTINPTTTSLSCSSDMNLKDNITNLSDNSAWSFNTNIVPASQSILDEILALNPVDYNWKTEPSGTAKHAGFIAQEVQEVFPDLVTADPTTHLLSLNYIGLMPYTIEAIKEMNLNVTDIDDLTRTDSWRDALENWFADSANGITNFFSATVTANQVNTQQLCIGPSGSQTCVTQQQLQQLLSNQSNSSTTTVISGGSSSNSTTSDDSSDTADSTVQTTDVSAPVITSPGNTQTPDTML